MLQGWFGGILHTLQKAYAFKPARILSSFLFVICVKHHLAESIRTSSSLSAFYLLKSLHPQLQQKTYVQQWFGLQGFLILLNAFIRQVTFAFGKVIQECSPSFVIQTSI